VVSAIVAFIISMGSSLVYTRVSTFFRDFRRENGNPKGCAKSHGLWSAEKFAMPKSSSITLSRENASQPPYSKISFQKVQGDTILFWQDRTDSLYE
jgi:hypothetical protein